jgi:uncharacterized protein
VLWNKSDPVEVRIRELWGRLSEEFFLGPHSYHGPMHWSRVESYGLYLAEQTGADVLVVRLFALFHDCCRVDEHDDPEHGLRGGRKARELRQLLPPISDDAFETLFQACAGHTDLKFSHDPTIATCWDSDRLDLDRVGMTPSPDFLSTKPARLLCHYDALDRRRLVGILPR